MHTAQAYNGMIVTPHRLATQAGLAILRRGGNAVEATIAAAATLGVVYPHMTSIGGDGFWLILPAAAHTHKAHGTAEHSGSAAPVFIDACGRSAALASHDWYTNQGLAEIPKRGSLAALTVAGAVSGWGKAMGVTACGGTSFPASRLTREDLLQDAITLAEQGFPVTDSQRRMTAASLAELLPQRGFSETFLANGQPPKAGSRMRLPHLAHTLRHLATEGFDSFYRGSLAKKLAHELEQAGSPLRYDDLAAHEAIVGAPLQLDISGIRLYNAPPPTQGMASLMILGVLQKYCERTGLGLHETSALVHAVVEATKQAFIVRDTVLADPAFMEQPAQTYLAESLLGDLAKAMSPDHALPWPHSPAGGDTVWLGAMDKYGNSVSYIQSVYHEFGSGLVIPDTGIIWQNRGLGFTFTPGTPNSLAPRKKPFHTLNPAMAVFDDGRVLSYGTMGGEGQPQTQAAIFARYALLGRPLQQAVSAPRWLLGRTWGDKSVSLKLEADFAADVFSALQAKGHVVERVPAQSSLMGHAGALVRHPDGLLEGAFDPRSDGSASCW